MIKVTCEVKVYEVDGKEAKHSPSDEPVIVSSHWNYRDRVVLTLNGKSVTVLADDLEKAINNATNTNKY